jgi:hypothetical protein
MIVAKTIGANFVSQNSKSCTGGEATKKREIPRSKNREKSE